MKYIFDFFSSTRTMAVLLIVFALSIAAATFIENDFGAESARNVVYNAHWFETLMLLGVLNIAGVIIRKKLYRKEKLTLFIFHVAFIVIIIGAGITRFFGSEGIMHIREGQTLNQWLTMNNYLNFKIKVNDQTSDYSFPVSFAAISPNKFDRKLNMAGHKVQIHLNKFYPKAQKTLISDVNGSPVVHIVSFDSQNAEDLFISQRQKIRLGQMIYDFTDSESMPSGKSILFFISGNNNLKFVSSAVITCTSMTDGAISQLQAGQAYPFISGTLYNTENNSFVLKEFLQKGSVIEQPVENKQLQLSSALLFDISIDGHTNSTTIWGQPGIIGMPSEVSDNGLTTSLSYGAVSKTLPFSLKLNAFILRRYSGSESPSWFESNVQLIDPQKNINIEKRIFMNHVLRYKGYKFYQASYDSDEKGTILSLNHDRLGSSVTYLGYILMALGMVLSLFNRKSHFRKLAGKDLQHSNNIKSMLAGLILLLPLMSYSQTGDSSQLKIPVIDKIHAGKFGELFVQDNSGRIVSLNTLNSQLLRKISRKNIFEGQNPDQVLLGMQVFPAVWQRIPIIRIGHPDIQKMLGIKTNYAAFEDFFPKDVRGTYLLQSDVETAYRKRPDQRSKLDNELIRTDERVNVCYLIYTGEELKIFPDLNDSSGKWYSPATAHEISKSDDSVFTDHIIQYYTEEVTKSVQTGNWKVPNEIVQSIEKYQKKYGSHVMPSIMHVKAEEFYNQANIFSHVADVYLLIGLILLLAQFINLFLPRFNIRYFSVPAAVLITIAFIYQAFGLKLRWYISGHAPWSNGYEALTFIAWVTVLAGLIFSKKSSITISSTAILAALILQTAQLSWMDPQVTNLVPVLNSYWLVIHVAVITASYGFLGLGALLAGINLLLMIFETKNNFKIIDDQIDQLSRIIELTLIVGLYLLTIGTFLGGVWANESWGRYWGWDPKETWALVTIIVYAFILHMRIIPGLKSRLLFNIMSLAGFASVLMTYFGVNYYLSGLHSYAKRDPLPVPAEVYYSVSAVILICILAALNQRNKKTISMKEKSNSN